jgi:predicted RND superfamily exporter protein
MERFYACIVNKPKSIVALICLLTGVFGYHAWHIQLNSSVDSLLPAHAYYQEVRRLFGSDEIGVIGLLADYVYSPSIVRKIRRLTAKLKAIPEVKDVYSLTTVPDVNADVIADVMGDQPLIAEIPATDEAWAALKQRIAAHPIYLKNLVSADGRATAIIVVFLESLTDEDFLQRGIDERIQTLVDQENGPEELYYAGLPHFRAYMLLSARLSGHHAGGHRGPGRHHARHLLQILRE